MATVETFADAGAPAEAIARCVGRGWRVESDSGERVVIVKGESRAVRADRRKRPNHVLHLLLTLITAGLWLPVWLLIAMRSAGGGWSGLADRFRGGEQRRVLTLRR